MLMGTGRIRLALVARRNDFQAFLVRWVDWSVWGYFLGGSLFV